MSDNPKEEAEGFVPVCDDGRVDWGSFETDEDMMEEHCLIKTWHWHKVKLIVGERYDHKD